MKTSDDFINTRRWALAFVGGGGFVVSAQTYMLANCDTGRAHLLHFVGGGLMYLGRTAKPVFSVSRKLSYKRFNTSTPANFNDFNGGTGRITELKVKAILSYSKTILNIWAVGRVPFVDSRLAEPRLGGGFGVGWSASLPKGQAFVHGIFAVHFGNGDPHGIIPDARLNLPEVIEPSRPRLAKFSNLAYEDPILLPADVLFEFDSAHLGAGANESLELAASIIEQRRSGGVTIEGHTDSIGLRGYNQDLSLRRAVAVREWFVKYGLYRAKGFVVRGRGELMPVAANKNLDGSDNPDGRKLNRRVEILFGG